MSQTQAALEIIRAVADCIKELGEVPSGLLYARLMSHMTLDQYQQIIGILVRSGIVKQSDHVLTWNA